MQNKYNFAFVFKLWDFINDSKIDFFSFSYDIIFWVLTVFTVNILFGCFSDDSLFKEIKNIYRNITPHKIFFIKVKRGSYFNVG